MRNHIAIAPRRALVVAAVALLGIGALAPHSATACPSCKTTLTGQEQLDEARLAVEVAAMKGGLDTDEAAAALGKLDRVERQVRTTQGFFWSILFMMSAPFAILGVLGFALNRAMHKARVHRAAPMREFADSTNAAPTA